MKTVILTDEQIEAIRRCVQDRLDIIESLVENGESDMVEENEELTELLTVLPEV